MAVYQNKNNSTKDGRSWYFRTYYTTIDGTRKQFKSKRYETKKEAKEQEIIFLTNLTNKIEIKSITFLDLINDYMEFQKDKVKISSYINYNKHKSKLKQFHNIKLNEFSIEKFNLWKKEINKMDYSTAYKNNLYKFLVSILNYATKYYDYDYSRIKAKMTGFTNPNELKKEMLFWTYEEFIQFISKETDIRYKCYFETLYYCGLRKGEAGALTWKDIDLNNKTIVINKNLTQKIRGEKYVILPPKTKSSNRILSIPDILNEHLKELNTYFKKFSNYSNNWFVYGGVFPLSDTSVQNHRNNNCINSNTKIIRIHDFRHSCASLLISNGASISLVAKYLGHSNISTTLNTYTHMFKNEMNDIINIINNLEKRKEF